MKKVKFILGLLFASYLTVSAQLGTSAGGMNYTEDLPIVLRPATPSAPAEFIGSMEIMSDAITTNTGNSNSSFDEGTVFVMYSPLREEDPNTSWIYAPSSNYPSAGQEIGTWVQAYNRAGNLFFHKKIVVPTSFDILRENNPTPFPYSFLRVASLRYDYTAERELLVFTGSIRRDKGHDQNTTTYEVMVVGTYNLSNNTVSISAIDDIYTYNNGSGNEQRLVGSEGVSVRSIGEDNFLAIGQSGDGSSSSTQPTTDDANYPIGVVFSVNNSGVVNILRAEVKDFIFKPLSATKVGRNNGELMVAGIQQYSQPHSYPYSTGSTTLSPAVYSFEAVYSGGAWSVQVNNGIALNISEYSSSNQNWTSNYSHIDIFEDDDRVFIGTTNAISSNTTIRGVGTTVFMELDIDLTMVNNEIEIALDAAGSFDYEHTAAVHRLIPIGNDKFKAVVVVDDQDNEWGTPNNTAVAYMDMSYSGGSLSGPSTYKAMYTDDQAAPYNINKLSHVTGVYETIPGPGNQNKAFYFADHLYQYGSWASSYVHTVTNEEPTCFNPGITLPLSIQSDPVIYGSQVRLSLENAYGASLNVTDIDIVVSPCSYWGDPQPPAGQRKKNTKLPTVLDVESEVQKPEVVTLSNNVYQINNTENIIQNYAMFNAAGQKVSITIKNNIIDMNNLKTGVYFLRFQDNNEVFSEKLIANH